MRSHVAKLPSKVRRELMRKLYERGFSDYAGLSSELRAAGHPVSKSALQRFGQKLAARVQQVELDGLLKHDPRGE
jgi:hypothetical protein